MAGSSAGVTRRDFLKLTAAGLGAPALTAGEVVAQREVLHNGIVLAHPWPPDRRALPLAPLRPPYLANPPAVIGIDLGRQLFVDDFLVEESALHRSMHSASYHPSSPVLRPITPVEQRDPHAELTGNAPSPSAYPFSDGVFFDPASRVFKMWYMAGYQQHTALATSVDGLAWDRPSLDVLRGTNVVFTEARDSTTVWLDHDSNNPAERFKMSAFLLDGRAIRLYTSPDGIHWRNIGRPGPSGDRSTFYFDPFRRVWVFSLRADASGGVGRFRTYVESRDFASTRWTDSEPVVWAGADAFDMVRPDLETRPELYNLDAVAYESVLLGLFGMYRGEATGREKPNDICLGFSRDGFHWSRPDREPFIAVSEHQGAWNWSNVQSVGGGCLVVGDRLYFYVSGRAGVPGTSLPGVCTTGLAVLRRDGFASLTDEWPGGVARLMTRVGGTLTTRPVRFSGRYLFVNANAGGELKVEVLDREGRVIAPFSADNCVAVRGDSTRHRIEWRGAPGIQALAGEAVRFRFRLSRTRLYAFWISRSERGESGGYVAAGGPGLPGSRDT